VPNPHSTDLIDTLQVTLSTFTQFPVANAVGIDNIVVTAANSSVPDPTGILIAALLLVGSAFAVVALVRRRGRIVQKKS
jgi:predicted acyltransferase